uniref:Uncharacterized protein n=1 Tax=Oryza barthii TaxID=65489 RepID=A0A0D3GAQ5_9ORYZ
MIPLLIITVCPGLLYLGARGELWSVAPAPAIITSLFPMQAAVQQLDLLLVAALASRVAWARDDGGWARGRGAMNLLRRGAERFTVVA